MVTTTPTLARRPMTRRLYFVYNVTHIGRLAKVCVLSLGKNDWYSCGNAMTLLAVCHTQRQFWLENKVFVLLSKAHFTSAESDQ